MADISQKLMSSPCFPILLKHYYSGSDDALIGNHDEARKHVRFLEEYYYEHSVGELPIAGIYMYLGDFDRVFEWLNRAYDARVSRLTDIYSFPSWEPIRSDQRYKALIKKMGFPE